MATIRNNRGRWQAIVRRKGFPQQSKTFRTKSQAAIWARQTETHLDAAICPVNTQLLHSMSVSDILSKYRETVTVLKKGRASESKRIDSFLKQSWARFSLIKATPGVFSLYRDQRLKLVKPATVRRDLGLLRAIFEVARQEWDIPLVNNPLSSVRKPKEPNARTRRLEEGELDMLLGASERHRAPWLNFGIQLAVETGMRRGELLSALWDDVSFRSSTLLIRETKNGFPRRIPLSGKAVELMENRKPLDCSVDRHIIPTSANAFQLAWQRTRKNVSCIHPGILELHFHDLRHEAISRFFEMGLSLAEVAAISGHRDPRMLFRYTHLRAEDIAAKINAVHRLATDQSK